jgi:hypothetical protein
MMCGMVFDAVESIFADSITKDKVENTAKTALGWMLESPSFPTCVVYGMCWL